MLFLEKCLNIGIRVKRLKPLQSDSTAPVLYNNLLINPLLFSCLHCMSIMLSCLSLLTSWQVIVSPSVYSRASHTVSGKGQIENICDLRAMEPVTATPPCYGGIKAATDDIQMSGRGGVPINFIYNRHQNLNFV